MAEAADAPPKAAAGGAADLRPAPATALTPGQEADVESLLASEGAGGGSHVFCGPPGCGKTQALLELLRRHPMAARGVNAQCVNVVVVHYMAFADWRSRAESLGVPGTLCVARNFYGKLRAAVSRREDILLLCTPTTFRRCAEELGGTPVQRVVVDDWDSVFIPNFPPPGGDSCRTTTWFVTNHPQWHIHCTWRLDRLAKRVAAVHEEATRGASAGSARTSGAAVAPAGRAASRVVASASAPAAWLAPGDVVRPTAETSRVHATLCPHLNAVAIRQLCESGHGALAHASFPGVCVRRSSVSDPRVAERLAEECPVCYEEAGAGARVVCPHCRQTLCLKCAASNLCVSSSCAMCRGDATLADCTMVCASPPRPLPSDTEALNSTLAEIHGACPDARVLLVAEYDCEEDIPGWRSVSLSGNLTAIQSKVRRFDAGLSTVMTANARTVGCAGLRLARVTHVVFVGALTSVLRAHWLVRARSLVGGAEETPSVVTVQSVFSLSNEISFRAGVNGPVRNL